MHLLHDPILLQAETLNTMDCLEKSVTYLVPVCRVQVSILTSYSFSCILYLSLNHLYLRMLKSETYHDCILQKKETC